MLIVISPAKTLDFETPATTDIYSTADFLDKSAVLIKALRKLAPQDVCKLMGISDKLGVVNYDRFQAWRTPFSVDNAKQAILAFKGGVYTGLNAEKFSASDFKFAQKHLRILSGLYGLLRPMDLMQAYRLEMGSKFATSAGKDLYAFWGDKITQALNNQLKATKSGVLINLASNEYSKVIRQKALSAEVITPVFKDLKGGKYKVVSFFAKKARGMMSAYIIQRRLTKKDQLKTFAADGYCFNKAMSSNSELVFTRD